MNKYKVTMTCTEGCSVCGHSWAGYGRKAFIWSLGKIVQRGDSGSRIMGLMSLQVPCGHVLLAGTWGSMGLGAMVNALHSLGLPNVSLPFYPLPGYLCALAFLTSVPRLWLAFPFDWQESGKTQLQRVSVVALQVRWDPARASQFHYFCGPAKAILGNHQGNLMEHRDLAGNVSALLVCWVSCQPPF